MKKIKTVLVLVLAGLAATSAFARPGGFGCGRGFAPPPPPRYHHGGYHHHHHGDWWVPAAIIGGSLIAGSVISAAAAPATTTTTTTVVAPSAPSKVVRIDVLPDGTKVYYYGN
ncbi:MAG: hypothetical protein IKS15_05570 [Opitutales bacterium]|nr:hypothetical protein [Opitutales bacterium]